MSRRARKPSLALMNTSERLWTCTPDVQPGGDRLEAAGKAADAWQLTTHDLLNFVLPIILNYTTGPGSRDFSFFPRRNPSWE